MTLEDTWYGYNPHSDVETLTTTTGVTKATYGYTAFGKDRTGAITGDTTGTNPATEPYNLYRYAAKRFDPGSGDYDMGFRDYNPSLNSFLTRDMYGGALADIALGTDPWNTNRYAFTGGNPISRVELDGHVNRGASTGGSVPDETPESTQTSVVGVIGAIAGVVRNQVGAAAREGARATKWAYFNAPAYAVSPLEGGQSITPHQGATTTYNFVIGDAISSCRESVDLECAAEAGMLLPWGKPAKLIKPGKLLFDSLRTGRKAANGGAAAVRMGQAGENAVRSAYQIGDKTPFNVLGRDRIADGLTSTTVSEVKNVGYQAYTQQLKDYVTYSIDSGRRFDLFVRGGANPTILSSQLEEAVGLGQVTLRYIP